ncbi:hypothetical protein MPH47_20805 [Psychrobacillus psychrodurans]|uniref:hypothetical protein n=1 Tax=Psychrobacillus TaxID=1221880 RepID=UPI001F4E61A5|nr:hypothetical protein [Psychrobacillus psychrodurans]MCK1999631.1 hypothetical protein [Psychrobacillus psychrodurans]
MELFKNKSEILNYNLVNESNQVIPNYDLSNKEVYFELYISQERTICIIGKVDNNYICWCSITKLNDKENNEEIFNYIANISFNIFSQEYLVLAHERYNEIKNWYKCDIARSNIDGMCWRTPFGHYYGDDSVKDNHGKYFARDILHFYEELLEKCNFRINEGLYIDILNNYLYILSKDVIYNKIKPLISILECESYLRLSPNETVRDLYLRCVKESSSLYNRYMDEVR